MAATTVELARLVRVVSRDREAVFEWSLPRSELAFVLHSFTVRTLGARQVGGEVELFPVAGALCVESLCAVSLGADGEDDDGDHVRWEPRVGVMCGGAEGFHHVVLRVLVADDPYTEVVGEASVLLEPLRRGERV